jgi:glutamate racemase
MDSSPTGLRSAKRSRSPPMNNQPIGVFDSGFGGLTVMRAIQDLLPHESIIYFGDTAHLPYGEKSPETIIRYTLECAQFLIEQQIKILVIACHTASTAALELLQKTCPIPVVGVIAPSIQTLVHTTKTSHIGVIGTRATISSGVYQTLIQQALPQAQIIAFPCPLFVPLVEEGYASHPLSQLLVHEYLRPLCDTPVDTLLLGCTHYPLLAPFIQQELGPQVSLVDPAVSCARYVAHLLESQNAENITPPQYQFFVSDDPEKFRQLGSTFLNHPISQVQKKARISAGFTSSDLS